MAMRMTRLSAVLTVALVLSMNLMAQPAAAWWTLWRGGW